ncbi:hypothetical protein IZ6_23080 [Terrihabitans soli]|uniref:Uncharacterized protein n=1 Tax=Terrihabitans soli TaxID=708113 RepID=A0A6S6QJV2_9HYPH|nr:hypothetical protein [Terrihabitans soli]BCJ91573.1 hypothetical protein IZ6_23080 [Terrihabitans soli]
MSKSALNSPIDRPALIEPSASDLIRAHLRNARDLAAEHGYSNLMPLLEMAGFGLEEVEFVAQPVRCGIRR